MIDKKEFNSMVGELTDFDSKREDIIKNSRDILKLSKQAIYNVHRGDLNYAKKNLDEAKKMIGSIKSEIKKDNNLDTIGAFNAALQEFVEGITYYSYVKDGKIPTKKELKVDTTNYLLGICDLTGELGRRAVFLTIDKKYDEVKKIYDVVSDIFGEFLKFDFRNGELRKKSDSIKYNMKKIEEIMYDIQKLQQ
jgi:predicted translin family RNA/ssDNA-binding protein